jgi:hypothetical protein
MRSPETPYIPPESPDFDPDASSAVTDLEKAWTSDQFLAGREIAGENQRTIQIKTEDWEAIRKFAVELRDTPRPQAAYGEIATGQYHAKYLAGPYHYDTMSPDFIMEASGMEEFKDKNLPLLTRNQAEAIFEELQSEGIIAKRPDPREAKEDKHAVPRFVTKDTPSIEDDARWLAEEKVGDDENKAEIQQRNSQREVKDARRQAARDGHGVKGLLARHGTEPTRRHSTEFAKHNIITRGVREVRALKSTNQRIEAETKVQLAKLQELDKDWKTNRKWKIQLVEAIEPSEDEVSVKSDIAALRESDKNLTDDQIKRTLLKQYVPDGDTEKAKLLTGMLMRKNMGFIAVHEKPSSELLEEHPHLNQMRGLALRYMAEQYDKSQQRDGSTPNNIREMFINSFGHPMNAENGKQAWEIRDRRKLAADVYEELQDKGIISRDHTPGLGYAIDAEKLEEEIRRYQEAAAAKEKKGSSPKPEPAAEEPTAEPAPDTKESEEPATEENTEEAAAEHSDEVATDTTEAEKRSKTYQFGLLYTGGATRGKKNKDIPFSRMSLESFTNSLEAEGYTAEEATQAYLDLQNNGVISKVHVKGAGFVVNSEKLMEEVEKAVKGETKFADARGPELDPEDDVDTEETEGPAEAETSPEETDGNEDAAATVANEETTAEDNSEGGGHKAEAENAQPEEVDDDMLEDAASFFIGSDTVTKKMLMGYLASDESVVNPLVDELVARGALAETDVEGKYRVLIEEGNGEHAR